MKIVRIVSELDFGGVEQVLANSVPTLVQVEGVELNILVLGQGGKIADDLIGRGFSVQILNARPRIPNIHLVYTVSKILFQLKPDVVHTQGSEANFHGILAAKLVGVPRIIGEEIGLPNHHSYWKWIFRSVYSQAHQVITISEAVKKEIVELGEVNEDKVKVLYNPVTSLRWTVDSGQWTGNNKMLTVNHGKLVSIDLEENKPFVFVTTCRLVPIKNLDRLIQAFSGLIDVNPERKLLLRIVGDGPEREKLESLSQKSEMGARIEFTGFQQDIWPFLEEANVFILPSLREGSSVSLAEAMSVGLPSIVTKVGGALEILGDSNSGILIDPLDIDSIQSAMQQMLDLSHEERQTMGERAKKESQRFSVDNYIKELIKIYQSPIS